MDFSKYKDRLVDYAKANGIDASENKNVKCFLPEHGSSDSSPSMRFKDDRYRCFKCDVSGDIYDLAGFFNNTDVKVDQYNIISKYYDGVIYEPEPKKEKSEYCKESAEIVNQYMRSQAKKNKGKVLSFAKFRGYDEEFSKYIGYWPGVDTAIKDIGEDVLKKTGVPVPYTNKDGEKKGVAYKPSGIIFKYEKGWKLMYRRGEKTVKRASWDCEVFPYPKLFDIDRIILVEAEISALAGALNGLKMVSTGGTNGLNKYNYSKLHKYKEIVFCFDADDAGRKDSLKHASGILDSGYNGIIKISRLKKCDFGKDPDDYIKSGNVEDLKSIIDSAPLFHRKEDEQEEIEVSENEWPFRFLGFTEHSHYFLDRKDMITKIQIGKMTSGILLEIASLDFWKSIKMGRQGSPDWQYIFDLIIDKSVSVGPYKKTGIRGAGIWQDNGEIIASDGEFIICSDGKVSVKDYKSKLTYIRRAPIGIDSIENDTHKNDFDFIVSMTKDLSFASDQDGKLLFGWIISSIFLSVIKWRPIVYMKGPSSVGKSWVMNNIVRGILDGIAISPKKNSTVIGVMQAPGYDSRMTTIDELENGQDKKTQELVRGLMTLARDTTTKSKESRYVGTQDQEGSHKDFSSMFLFASIVESSEEDQDVNRITSVEFYPKDQIEWPKIESKILYEFNNGIGDRIRHNAIYHRNSIVKNIFLFQKVSGVKALKQRNADQLGALIAGWYHLENPGEVATEEEAIKYVSFFDFTAQNERTSGETMKYIMSSILSAKIVYEEEAVVNTYDGVRDQVKRRERTVYEILQHLKKDSDRSPRHSLNKALMAYGLRFGTKKNPNYLAIAQGHEGVRKMLPPNFAYKRNYADYFKNHKDFIEKEKSVKFIGTSHQALIFKIDLDDEDYDDKVPF